MREHIVSAGERDQRLEKFIKRKLPEATTSFVYKMLRKKNITLNGKKADGKEMVQTGDKVTFFLSDETYEKFAGRTGAAGTSGHPDSAWAGETAGRAGTAGTSGKRNAPGVARSAGATGNVRTPQGGRNAATGGSRGNGGRNDRNVPAGGSCGNGGRNDRNVPTGGSRGNGTRNDRNVPASGSRVREYQAAYAALTGKWRELKVLVETKDLLLVNKPAGVLSQKAKDTDQSLNEWFVGYLLHNQQVTEDSLREFTPSIANRLDRNTAGIVICAKTLLGSRVAARLLREKSQDGSARTNAGSENSEYETPQSNSGLHKYYHMIVKGRAPRQGVLEGWITKDPKSNMVQVFDTEPVRTGAADVCSFARTEYKSLQYDGKRDLTLIEAELITGRTHQLRAQMQHMGHPILGDPKYGDNKLNERYKEKGVRSQLLACVRVEFPQMEEPEMAALSGAAVKAPAPSIFERVLS